MAVKDTTNGTQLANEVSAGAHVPFTCHVDPHTLKAKDGKICQVIKLEGVAFTRSPTGFLMDTCCSL